VQILKHALENAVSVAGTLLLTEATLTEVKDERVDKLQAELAGM
jgi:chaperonin GroEL (HSP60 family)